MGLSKQLLTILACPVCHGKLQYEEEQDRLNCLTCEVAYPVTDDVPVLLSDEAIPLQ